MGSGNGILKNVKNDSSYNAISDSAANIVLIALNGFVGRSGALRVFMPMNIMNHHADNERTPAQCFG